MERIYVSFVLVLLLIDLRFMAAQGSNEIRQLSWSPNGQILATAKADGTVLLWNEENFQQLSKLVGHSGDISDLAWNPDGTQLVTSSIDRTARVWDTTNGTSLLTVEGLGGSTTKVAWSPDGKTIATSYIEGPDNLVLRDALTGKTNRSATVQTPVQMGWSHDGTKFAIMLPYAPNIFIWDSEFTKSIGLSTGATDIEFSSVFAWSPNSSPLLVGTGKGTIQLIDSSRQSILAIYRTTEATPNPDDLYLLTAKDPFVYATISVAFNADGSEIMSVNADGTVRKWSVATGEMISSAHIDVAKTTYTPYPIVDWSPYRGRMIYLSDDTPTDASSETDLAALGVKIVTPFASDEQLRSLVNLCEEEAAAKTTLASLIAAQRYTALADAVKALSAAQIPPACAADIAAVAAAMGEK